MRMFKSKIVGIMALIVFAIGIVWVGDALGGEKVKGRTVHSNTKWQHIDAGDEDGHVAAIFESKGVQSVSEGRKLFDGVVYRQTGLLDMNLKTGLGSGHYFWDITDKDGDKYYGTAEGKAVKAGYWVGTTKIAKGTGKFKGIQGKGTWQWYAVGDQGYSDWEMEVELPR
jgi:hypothetical protein